MHACLHRLVDLSAKLTIPKYEINRSRTLDYIEVECREHSLFPQFRHYVTWRN